MSVEELMKPRFKCIADYPFSAIEVGSIIPDDGGHVKVLLVPTEDGPYSSINIPSTQLLWDFGHLFKKLEWWEERAREDLPAFLRVLRPTGAGEVVKVHGWNTEHSVIYATNSGLSYAARRFFIPATEEEYNAQKVS